MVDLNPNETQWISIKKSLFPFSFVLEICFFLFFINIFYGLNSKEIVNYFLIIVKKKLKKLLNHKRYLVS
jgi:hypothetical protein